jgi:hypothetical protein
VKLRVLRYDLHEHVFDWTIQERNVGQTIGDMILEAAEREIDEGRPRVNTHAKAFKEALDADGVNCWLELEAYGPHVIVYLVGGEACAQ